MQRPLLKVPQPPMVFVLSPEPEKKELAFQSEPKARNAAYASLNLSELMP